MQRADYSYGLEPVTGLFVAAPVSLFALAFYLLLRKSARPENRPLALITLFMILGLCLSFTGYYDSLRIGSPETYAALEQFFHPLEVVFKAMAG